MENPYLPISNSRVFAKVMQDNPNLCKQVAERLLGIDIEEVVLIDSEHTVNSVECRSVRVDALIRSTHELVEIEMQSSREKAIGRRLRYYAAMIDSRELKVGQLYSELPDLYMVYIAMFDPYRKGYPIYEFQNECMQDPGVRFRDGVRHVIVNATGNMDMLDGPVRNLVQYLGTSIPHKGDDLTMELSKAVDSANKDGVFVTSIMEEHQYLHGIELSARMEGLEEGRAEGLAEGKAQGEARMSALVAKMKKAGASPEDIVDAMLSSDKESLFAEYGL